MNISPFKLERYFAQYEFSATYLLSSSDCDGLFQQELINLADVEMKEAWDKLMLGYTESLGNPILRNEVSRLYTNVNPKQVLIVTPEEGIFLAMQSLLQSGDHVICTFPGYQSLYEIAEGIGCEVSKWTPEEQKGWEFNVHTLESLIKTNTKLIVVNFPHNPTGYLPSKEIFNQILELAKEHGIYVFSDEMYRLLEYDTADRLPSACEQYDKAISLFGMSKTFGMAGVRIGWVVTKDEEVYKRMATLKDYTTICSSVPSEILSIIALRIKDIIIGKHLSRIDRNLKLLDRFFETYAYLFEWVRPKAGTIAFPKIKLDSGAMDFCQKLVKTANIMLLPSTVYDTDDSHVRLGFGRENMPEALEKFEDYLKSNYS